MWSWLFNLGGFCSLARTGSVRGRLRRDLFHSRYICIDCISPIDSGFFSYWQADKSGWHWKGVNLHLSPCQLSSRVIFIRARHDPSVISEIWKRWVRYRQEELYYEKKAVPGLMDSQSPYRYMTRLEHPNNPSLSLPIFNCTTDAFTISIIYSSFRWLETPHEFQAFVEFFY